MSVEEPAGAADAEPSWGPTTEDRLTRDVVLWQRRHGHRFSSDDVVTAFVAVQAAPTSQRVLDLGCGIGSVLLHLAWSLPNTTLVGVEAQAISYSLLRANVRRNALEGRIRTVHRDLREDLSDLGGPFDLITGTPPYFPPDTATDALDEQRAYARIEYRGGIEAYVKSAAPLLVEDTGRFVVCGDARAESRLAQAADEAGLCVLASLEVVAHAPKPPLFTVWTLGRGEQPKRTTTMTLRDAEGRRTQDADTLRAFSGFPV